MRIPREIEARVVTKLYADASLKDWASMTPQQHSVCYANWVEDPEVGGRLKAFLADSEVRVWIKDGPMKEWSRARSGVGRYADLIEAQIDIPTMLVKKVLGVGWELVEGSVRTKPLRLTARRGEDESVITWADERNLKHLVWAALSASAEGDVRPWTICVIENFTHPTPSNERNAHQRLASRCGLAIRHISLT